MLSLFDLRYCKMSPMTFVICIAASFILHVIADFNLQGILGDLKQKDWWKKNYPDKKYESDWITALFIHSLFWSIFTFIPLLVSIVNIHEEDSLCLVFLVITWVINTFVHCVVDFLKANAKIINLTQDQLSHFIQINVTYLIWAFYVTNL